MAQVRQHRASEVILIPLFHGYVIGACGGPEKVAQVRQHRASEVILIPLFHGYVIGACGGPEKGLK